MPDNDQTQLEARPFRVLSLDGGGSKGVYTIGVLKEIEAVCKKPLCEVFDLIYGTSTGSIIAALLALGHSVKDIEDFYYSKIPLIMEKKTKGGRTRALIPIAEEIFGRRDFSEFKTHIGIVCTNYDFERPMIFKNAVVQAHGRADTFKPGFGCTIADAVIASCAAYPFFDMREVKTENQGQQLLMDGGYVANNPTLFAMADARQAFKVKPENLAVISIGVGSYNEPKRSIFHETLFGLWPFKHIAKMFNISSKTIEQLRVVLFPDIDCVRISDAFPEPRYATDLLEADVEKLKILQSLGRESFSKQETAIRKQLGLQA